MTLPSVHDFSGLEVPEQALDGIPLDVGLFMELKPSYVACHTLSSFDCSPDNVSWTY